ncbi:MAG: hypothetical protein ACRD0W_05250 [Acidimicrobiales bacterium]
MTRPPSLRRVAAVAGLKLLLLAALAVPVVTALPYGTEFRPPGGASVLSERDQHRAVAVKSYAVSHGCRTSEPFPPVKEQRSALVEDAPGVIRLTSIGEGRAVLSGAPGTLLAVCER